MDVIKKKNNNKQIKVKAKSTKEFPYMAVKNCYQNSPDSRMESCNLVDFEAELKFRNIDMITCSKMQDIYFSI